MNKPTLVCTSETIFKVDVHNLESFIKEVTGHTYECAPNEEWGNMTEHRFPVGAKLNRWESKDWLAFKKTGEQKSFKLRIILDGLCAEGHLVPGTYLICVCW